MKFLRSTNFEGLEIAQRSTYDLAMNADKAGDAIATLYKGNLDLQRQFAKIGITDYFGKGKAMTLIANKEFTNATQQATGEVDGLAAGADKATKAQAELIVRQTNISNNLQDFVNLGVAPATQALSYLTQVVENLTSILPGSKSKGYGQQGTGTKGGSLAATGAGAAAGATALSFLGPLGVAAGGIGGGLLGYAGYQMHGGAAVDPMGLANLRELIASGESSGNYNVMVGGGTEDLTNMTLAQVMQLQKQRVASGQGSAAGKYQIINKTLEGLIKEGRIDTSQKFDQNMQDRLADMLIKRRGLVDYQTGKISKEQFAQNLSKEWAALPSSAAGKSYHEGVGNNRASMSWDQLMRGVEQTKTGPSGAFGFRGTVSGPMSGYRPNITMHGTEELSIKPAGSSSTNPNSSASEGTMTKLVERMDDLIAISKNQLGVNEKMLKYAQ
jgi:muramidase (phage lysozyme)